MFLIHLLVSLFLFVSLCYVWLYIYIFICNLSCICICTYDLDFHLVTQCYEICICKKCEMCCSSIITTISVQSVTNSVVL